MIKPAFPTVVYWMPICCRVEATNSAMPQRIPPAQSKAKSHVVDAISAVYWLAVTAIFLFYTFGPNGNGQPQYSWFIWAVGGVLYGALMAGLSIYRKKQK